MLQDPEEFEEEAIVVYAESLSQAEAIGKKRAKALSDPNTIVECISCTKATKTTDKYICVLRIEARKS